MSAIDRFWALSLVSISVTACSSDPVPARVDSATEAPVKRFLAFYFGEYGRGLPEDSQLTELASFLTPELMGLFEAAIEGERCYLEKIDNEGPSPIQGDLFSSLTEGATSATYYPIAQETNTATFEIEWTHHGQLAADPFVWTDQVSVVKTAGGWLIDDFFHDGTWEFMMKGNVSQILRTVAEECVG